MKLTKIILLAGLLLAPLHAEVKMTPGNGTLHFTGGEGPGKGKHVVLLAGDEEYRSEELIPIFGKILAENHGFETTVLFSADPDGTINPDAGRSLMGAEALDKADAIVMLIRFRGWNDEAMTKFKAAIDRGVPIVAMRTSTHAFKFKGGNWQSWSWDHSSGGFGRQVLGETWLSHWGVHGKEATRTVVEPGNEKHPILRGVGEIFGPTDVYEVAPVEDATVLLRGIVVKGMKPTDPPAEYEKKTKKGVTQKVNDPAMPVAWTREVKNEAGTTNKVLTTTMGTALEMVDEDFRRLIVNGVYWGLGLEVPEKAEVPISAEFEPSRFSFKKYKKNMKAEDFVK